MIQGNTCNRGDKHFLISSLVPANFLSANIDLFS